MSEQIVIHVCPNGCANATFTTTAHVTQDWEVDAEGDYLKTLDECVQVDHGPDKDNLWTCSKCGADGEKITCVKQRIIVPASASGPGSKPVFLYAETRIPAKAVPRVYFTEHVSTGLVPVPVEPDGAGSYSTFINGMKIKID